jgi:predicted RNA-binding protein YlqC (UPF0109 family)
MNINISKPNASFLFNRISNGVEGFIKKITLIRIFIVKRENFIILFAHVPFHFVTLKCSYLFSEELISMKEFVEYIAKHLVDKPEEVKVTEVKGDQITIYELRVGKGDLGKVIGREGQNAKAIRTLLNAAGRKSGIRTNLEIVE